MKDHDRDAGTDVFPTAHSTTDVTWSRVEEGFYVASRGGEFLGFVDRKEPYVFAVFDGYAQPRGVARDLGSAMAVLAPLRSDARAS